MYLTINSRFGSRLLAVPLPRSQSACDGLFVLARPHIRIAEYFMYTAVRISLRREPCKRFGPTPTHGGFQYILPEAIGLSQGSNLIYVYGIPTSFVIEPACDNGHQGPTRGMTWLPGSVRAFCTSRCLPGVLCCRPGSLLYSN